MKKKLILIIGSLLVLIALYSYNSQSKISPPVPGVHDHAGFVVFDNGEKVDFSNFKYMNIEPCSLHKENKNETPEQNQIEKAHLHSGVGNVVHSHREGAKWGDLFTNINYPLDYSKVTAFINGVRVENIKDTPIKAYDSLVLYIGDIDTNLLSQAVTKDYIKEIENESETCGK